MVVAGELELVAVVCDYVQCAQMCVDVAVANR